MEFVSSYAVEHMRIEEAHGMEFILRTPEYDTVQHDLSVRAADNGVSLPSFFQVACPYPPQLPGSIANRSDT